MHYTNDGNVNEHISFANRPAIIAQKLIITVLGQGSSKTRMGGNTIKAIIELLLTPSSQTYEPH